MSKGCPAIKQGSGGASGPLGWHWLLRLLLMIASQPLPDRVVGGSLPLQQQQQPFNHPQRKATEQVPTALPRVLGAQVVPVPDAARALLDNGTVVVGTGLQLLRDISATAKEPSVEIFVKGRLMVGDAAAEDFPDGVHIDGPRNVTITGVNSANGLSVLDFGRRYGVLYVGPGSVLAFRGLVIKGLAPSQNRTFRSVRWANVGASTWPTIVAEPGGRLEIANTTAYVYDNNCSLNIPVTLQQLQQSFGPNTTTFEGDTGPAFRLPDRVERQFPVLDMTGLFGRAQAGILITISTNNILVCENLPSSSQQGAASPAAGGSRKWWIALVVVGIALVVVLPCAGLLLLARLRHRQRMRRSKRQQELQLAKEVAAVLADGSAGMAGGAMGGTAMGSPTLLDTPNCVVGEPEDLQLGRLIATGGFGRVYKGLWKGVIVAVKVIDNSHAREDRPMGQQQAQHLREMHLSSSVTHPNVVATYKVWTNAVKAEIEFPGQQQGGAKGSSSEEANSPGPKDADTKEMSQSWLVLEYCDKASLRDAISDRVFFRHSGCAPPQQATPNKASILRTLVDIAAGMEYLHSLNICHGDLKSANVLLKSTLNDPRGFVAKIADFGLSRVLDGRTHDTTRTYGTVAYQPPELLSAGCLTKACDCYSFGIVMWEMWSGEQPFPEASMGQVFYAVVYMGQRPQVPVDCPDDYAELMKQCWAAEPATRPEFAEVVERLRAMAREGRQQSANNASSASPRAAAARPHRQQPEAPAAPGTLHVQQPDAAAALPEYVAFWKTSSCSRSSA